MSETMIPKFEAWHKTENRMIKNHQILSIGWDLGNLFLVEEVDEGGGWKSTKTHRGIEIELRQSSGLKDSNDTKIYQGDILKIEDPDLEIEIGLVRFTDGGFWVDGPDTDYCGLSSFTDCPDYKVKVLGNIYEHEHLLS